MLRIGLFFFTFGLFFIEGAHSAANNVLDVEEELSDEEELPDQNKRLHRQKILREALYNGKEGFEKALEGYTPIDSILVFEILRQTRLQPLRQQFLMYEKEQSIMPLLYILKKHGFDFKDSKFARNTSRYGDFFDYQSCYDYEYRRDHDYDGDREHHGKCLNVLCFLWREGVYPQHMDTQALDKAAENEYEMHYREKLKCFRNWQAYVLLGNVQKSEDSPSQEGWLNSFDDRVPLALRPYSYDCYHLLNQTRAKKLSEEYKKLPFLHLCVLFADDISFKDALQKYQSDLDSILKVVDHNGRSIASFIINLPQFGQDEDYYHYDLKKGFLDALHEAGYNFNQVTKADKKSLLCSAVKSNQPDCRQIGDLLNYGADPLTCYDKDGEVLPFSLFLSLQKYSYNSIDQNSIDQDCIDQTDQEKKLRDENRKLKQQRREDFLNNCQYILGLLSKKNISDKG